MSADRTAPEGNGGSSKELGKTKSTICPDHRDYLARYAVDPEVAQGHVQSVEKPEELPEGMPDTWAKELPATLHRWQDGDQISYQLRSGTTGGPAAGRSTSTSPTLTRP
jgi:hypothetical protein